MKAVCNQKTLITITLNMNGREALDLLKYLKSVRQPVRYGFPCPGQYEARQLTVALEEIK